MTFRSLAPGFLIASPPLGDPNFDRTVVLVAVHNEDGALGFVVNRASRLVLGELLELAGYERGHEDASKVWVGGPVQPQSGWVVSDDPEITGRGVIAVGQRLRISSSRAAFDEVARDATEPGDGGVRRLVMLGYSGWGPGQLESEIARGAWLPTPLDERVLFDCAAEDRWERAYALVGLTPGNMISMRTVGEA
ncbi:MAG: YqgE/AlgH family protein [Deltaproteobacteria bacterium]|nr:YqgE/AlgH family protein [Deltaproteobacteria bacterium]